MSQINLEGSQGPQDDPVLCAFQQGKLLAYPTEAVFGLGCDPRNQQAVEALLQLKQRPVEKGLILIARDYSQLLPFVNDDAIPMHKRSAIFSSWPGPVTWLLPKAQHVPAWLSGDSDMIAVRVTAHAPTRALCERLSSAIVSTSANLTGQSPATDAEQVIQQFNHQVVLVPGKVGARSKPSEIRHSVTGEIIRAG